MNLKVKLMNNCDCDNIGYINTEWLCLECGEKNEYQKRNDIESTENKKNIHCALRGDNKYYYAFQCALFTKNLLKFGYGHISKEEIAEKGICFNKYSINVGYNQYCKDLKRFNSKEEMLGFVIGYNEAVNNSKAI